MRREGGVRGVAGQIVDGRDMRLDMAPFSRGKKVDAKVGRQQRGELALDAVDVDLRQVVDSAVEIDQVLRVILHVLVDVVERGEVCDEGLVEQRVL